MAASIPELTSPTNTTRNQHSTEISIYQMEHQTCNLTETFDKYLRLLHLCLLGIPLLGEPLTLSTKQLPQNKRARISNRNAPKKNEQKRGGGGNINSLSPAGHPWIACAPRAPPACACAPRSPGAGHGASGEALCDLPAAAANSSRRKLKKNKKKKRERRGNGKTRGC